MGRIARFTAIFFFLGLLGGCGVKTALISPNAAIPKAIENLHFFQDESSVVLSWTYPAKTTSATKLNKIDSFLILRAVVPEADYCDTCPTSFTSSVEIPFSKSVQDRKTRDASYTERVLRPDQRYIYQVRTKAGWHLVSGDSNQVSFVWQSPALAPDPVGVEAGDGVATLFWDEVTVLADGTQVTYPLKYQVYRAKGNKTFLPVGPVLSEAKYRDTALLNGQNYDYKVRALRENENIKILGMSSRVVSVTPQDQTSPVPPRSLKMVALANGAVKLLWERNHEKDLAGYKIYRRSEPNRSWELLGETRFSRVFFVDTIPAGHTYYYAVTAFDQARQSNESLFSKELKYESF